MTEPRIPRKLDFRLEWRRFIIALAGGILAVAIVLDASRVSAQSAATATPEFEVASIKPCKDSPSEIGVSASPGKLNLNCQTVSGLLQCGRETQTVCRANGSNRGFAYLHHAHASRNDSGTVKLIGDSA
jgi:hypothetical protein